MKKFTSSSLLLFSLILGTLILIFIWWNSNRLPSEIHIAAGKKGGQYYQLASLLQKHFTKITGHKLVLHETNGSNENINLLKAKKVDLAIVQLGPLGIENYELITPLYPELLQVIVKNNGGIKSIVELAGKNIAISMRGSGMQDSAMHLLDHEKLTKHVRVIEQYLNTIETSDKLDAVIATTGLLNSDLSKLMQSGRYRILDIPNAKGLAMRQPFFETYTIPQGLYRGGKQPVPAKDIKTLGTMAILAGRKTTHSEIIEAILKAIFETNLKNQLPVLLNKQQAFTWALYPKHPTAKAYFNPYEGIDLVASFLESLSASKELIFALFACLYLIWKTRNQHNQKKQLIELSKQKEHLDSYLDRTIEIENEHINTEDPEQLKAALEEVTRIKLTALQEFTSEDLRADQAFQIFLMQCANLSMKIQSNIQIQKKRQQQDNKYYYEPVNNSV
ncbi:MAG: TAXI family TRAP transporter solute-binding subunit [Methylococcales bacterium]|jgi:uncharacterized protein|nr:TAXI family TRAP transporter solute-binding subunit [Methylococcales bacterium]